MILLQLRRCNVVNLLNSVKFQGNLFPYKAAVAKNIL